PLPADQQKAAKIAVFYDVGQGNPPAPDPYSDSLAADFSAAIQPYLSPDNVISEPYILGNEDKIMASVHKAIANENVNFIFFAGYSTDLDALETSIQVEQQRLQQASPSHAAPTPIPIFGGDGLYDLTRYTSNTHSIVYSTVYVPPLDINNPFVLAYNNAF